MLKRKDPFTQPNAKYTIFVSGLYDKVNTNTMLWAIDAAAVAAILALLTPFLAFWDISKYPKTSTAQDRKNTVLSREDLTTYLRPFVIRWVYRNSVMTDADIISCGLDPYDRIRTKIGRPDSKPAMTYQVATGGTHRFSAFYRQQPDENGVSRRAKPKGVGSIKVAIMILTPGTDLNTLDPDTFSRTLAGSRSPIAVAFDAADAGKEVVFAACYQTPTFVTGDWTTVQTMVIP